MKKIIGFLFLILMPTTSVSMGGLFKKKGAQKISSERGDVAPVCHNPKHLCQGSCAEEVRLGDNVNSSGDILKNAFKELSDKSVSSCQEGEVCHVCFSESAKDCSKFTYRDAKMQESYIYLSPEAVKSTCFVKDTYDFKYSVPKGLQELCHYAKVNTFELGAKINCIKHPGFKKCKKLMKGKKQAFSKDIKEYRLCKNLGFEKYNREVAAEQKRSEDCLYTYFEKEHGSSKRVWRDLMPSSCGSGSFVSENGVDCCTASDFENACVGSCSQYYVERTKDIGYLEP